MLWLSELFSTFSRKDAVYQVYLAACCEPVTCKKLNTRPFLFRYALLLLAEVECLYIECVRNTAYARARVRARTTRLTSPWLMLGYIGIESDSV